MIMGNYSEPYKKILVSTDFSTHAKSALRQAILIAQASPTPPEIVLVNVVADIRFIATTPEFGLLYGNFDSLQEVYLAEAKRNMEPLIESTLNDMNSKIPVRYELLIGEPHEEIGRFAQDGNFDLLLIGMSGHTAWEHFLLGSTAKRLIHNSKITVWAVHDQHVNMPAVVLAATDFSEPSRKAVLAGLSIANQSNAEFHILHVIDSKDVPTDVSEKIPEGGSVRESINQYAKERLEQFLLSLNVPTASIQTHLSWGTPWKEVSHHAQTIKADLIAIGSVGRTGLAGIFLGNTAEKILSSSKASVLTVK